MREELDPAALSPADRLREVAGILASGVLRLRARAALPTILATSFAPRILPESRHNQLELPAETSVTVHTG
jgi:hypothetical protein